MKKRLLRSLQPLASSIPLNWLVSLTGQRLFLPFYHSVQADQPLAHIRHLYDLRSLDDFEKDLDFLLKHYQPIDLKGLWDQLKSGVPFKENTFFLSFDDGLREIADHIAPLLLKKGIPATFFINSAFVANQGLFFRYQASLLIEQLAKQKVSEAQKKAIQTRLGTSDFKKAILNISYLEKTILQEIATILEISFDDFLKKEKPYLDHTQIQQLIAQGFTIGSHSVDHPLYHQLTLEEQIRQSRESQDFVNQHFPQAVKAFAFPFTDHKVYTAFFERIIQEQIVDISFGTAGLKQEALPFHLQRFPVEAFPFPIHELVSAEYFYYFGKSFLGKNKINRT